MEQTNHFQAMNQPQTNPQAAAQLYPNQIYQAAPMSSTKENTDNIYTRNMKRIFHSLVLAVFSMPYFILSVFIEMPPVLPTLFSSPEPFAISSSLCQS